MTIENFKSLPDYKQENIIFGKGQLVDFKVKDDSIFTLYSVYLFFVELRYDKVNNRLASIQIINEENELNKYLDWYSNRMKT